MSTGTGFAVAPRQHKEGELTKAIEHYTSQIPSGAYLAMAFGSIGLSIGFRAMGNKDAANFVGHWPSAFLLLGLYNKVVKLHGSE